MLKTRELQWSLLKIESLTFSSKYFSTLLSPVLHRSHFIHSISREINVRGENLPQRAKGNTTFKAPVQNNWAERCLQKRPNDQFESLLKWKNIVKRLQSKSKGMNCTVIVQTKEEEMALYTNLERSILLSSVDDSCRTTSHDGWKLWILRSNIKIIPVTSAPELKNSFE